MNVLITSASRKVALVKAFQQALTSESGGEVIAVDTDWRSAALYFADRSYLVPSGLGEGFLSAIDGICHRHDVTLLIPTRDEELPVFASRRKSMAERGVTVMVAAPEVIQTCQDKLQFIRFCQANGFGVPETFDLRVAFDRLPYPLFVKDRFGKGSRNAQVVQSTEQLKNLLARLPDPVIQELIVAPEFTIDLMADFSGQVLSAVARVRDRIVAGESFVGHTSKEPLVISESIRLAQALGLVGHNTLQCFLHDQQVKFIEVNPRYGGAANLGFAAGVLTPLHLVRLVSGKPVQPNVGEYKEGLTMLRYTEDLFIDETHTQIPVWDQSRSV